MGNQDFGLDPLTLQRVAQEIQEVNSLGVEICLVIGGGNIFRGMSGVAQGIERSTADTMGMLATVMNCLAMQSALEGLGVQARVISAIPITSVCEPYIRRRAIRHLEKGRVVLFAAGTGNPYFTTDTAAALRASEMGCDVILKGTKVDGVYSEDPQKVSSAERFKHISFMEVLRRDLKVMDAAAISLARDNDISIAVFSIRVSGELARIVQGQGTCTIISNNHF